MARDIRKIITEDERARIAVSAIAVLFGAT